MPYFVVIREAGPAWAPGLPIREQEQWAEHAAFMDALVADGFLVVGGPLGHGPRAMHIVDAGGEDEIRARFTGRRRQCLWSPESSRGSFCLARSDPGAQCRRMAAARLGSNGDVVTVVLRPPRQ